MIIFQLIILICQSILNGKMINTPSLMWAISFWTASLIHWIILIIRFHKFKTTLIAIISSGIGMVMNAAVIISNDGHMPYYPVEGMKVISPFYVLANENHKLLFLCDRLNGYSIGDIFLFFSMALLIAYFIVKIITDIVKPKIVEENT